MLTFLFRWTLLSVFLAFFVFVSDCLINFGFLRVIFSVLQMHIQGCYLMEHVQSGNSSDVLGPVLFSWKEFTLCIESQRVVFITQLFKVLFFFTCLLPIFVLPIQWPLMNIGLFNTNNVSYGKKLKWISRPWIDNCRYQSRNSVHC